MRVAGQGEYLPRGCVEELGAYCLTHHHQNVKDITLPIIMVCVLPGRASICPVFIEELGASCLTHHHQYVKYITYLSSWSACCRAGRVSAPWLC